MLHSVVKIVQYNIYDIFCCKYRSPTPEAAAPPPRRAERGFPLPLWRGVNSLANHSSTGSLCPVLQQPTRALSSSPNIVFDITLLREDGARRPPSYYGLPRLTHEFFTFRSSLFT